MTQAWRQPFSLSAACWVTDIRSHTCRKTLESSVAEGYLQCSILSLLLWSLVVEYQFIGLDENSCYTVGYTEDFATLICRKFCKNITELLQMALSMVQKWCDRTKLSINSQKTVVMQFTRKRCLRGLGHQSSLDIRCCWLPWTYSGQRICMEGTAENVRNMAYRASLHFHGHIW